MEGSTVTVQIGPFANLIGAHYWNAQEQACESPYGATSEAVAAGAPVASATLKDLLYSRSVGGRSKSSVVEEWVRSASPSVFACPAPPGRLTLCNRPNITRSRAPRRLSRFPASLQSMPRRI